MLRPDKQDLKRRLRGLQEQRRDRFGDRDRINAKIAQLNSYIGSADMSDPTMRRAVLGWRQEMSNLRYERKQISEGLGILKLEIDDIKRALEPMRFPY